MALPIKREYVSMQDLGIKSLFHLGPSGGDNCAWTFKAICRIASTREKDSKLLNGSFSLNLHSITKTLKNGLEKMLV